MARTRDLFQRGAYVYLVLRRFEFELITAEGRLAASFWGENVGFAVHVPNLRFWSAQRGGDGGRSVMKDIVSVIGMPGRYRALGLRWFTNGVWGFSIRGRGWRECDIRFRVLVDLMRLVFRTIQKRDCKRNGGIGSGLVVCLIQCRASDVTAHVEGCTQSMTDFRRQS